MGRAPCCDKVGLKRGRWTVEEDDILTKYIQTNGDGSWRSLPKNAGLLRCGKSCRLRWINYLKTDLKRGNISKQEEDMIIKLHASLGNKWSVIASKLPGRTDNEIKNYWNSHLSRKIDTFRRPNGEALPTVLVNNPLLKRKRGRTSRAAMKKNKSTKPSPPSVIENGNLDMPKSTSTISYQESMGELGGVDGNLMVGCPTSDIDEVRIGPPHDEEGLLLPSFHDINDMCSDQSPGPTPNKSLVVYNNEAGENNNNITVDCFDIIESSETLEGGEKMLSETSCMENGRIDWEWEEFVNGDNLWMPQQDEEIFSWLWDNDNNFNINTSNPHNRLRTGDDDPGMESEKKDALVAWLFS